MIFDVNLSWGSWPFLFSEFETVDEFVRELRRYEIGGGWVRSSEAAWNADLERCNRRLHLAWVCERDFTAIPTLNPFYGSWRDHLQTSVPAVAVLPNFHSYSLADSEFLKMAEAITAAGKKMLLPLRLEDSRNQHPLCQVPPVEVENVIELLERLPELELLVLNALFGEAETLLNSGKKNLQCDLAMAEKMDAPPEMNLIFGSNAPFFSVGAAIYRLNDQKKRKENVSEPILS